MQALPIIAVTKGVWRCLECNLYLTGWTARNAHERQHAMEVLLRERKRITRTVSPDNG